MSDITPKELIKRIDEGGRYVLEEEDMSDHKYIYLQPACCADKDTGRMWCEDPDPEDCEEGKPWVKYALADEAEDKIEELTKQLNEYKAHITQLNLAIENACAEDMWDDEDTFPIIICRQDELSTKKLMEVRSQSPKVSRAEVRAEALSGAIGKLRNIRDDAELEVDEIRGWNEAIGYLEDIYRSIRREGE